MAAGDRVEEWLQKWNLDSSWMFIMGMRAVVYLAKSDPWPNSWLRTQIYSPPETLDQMAISMPDPRRSDRAAEWGRTMDELLQELQAAWSREIQFALTQGFEKTARRPGRQAQVNERAPASTLSICAARISS